MPWGLRSFWTGSEGWAPLLIQYRIRSSLRTMVDGSVCGLYRPSVSMNRPSRGERRSATTTRHWGSFFPPTRVSRMLTAISGQQDSVSALAHQVAEIGHLALLDPAHQLAHLIELLDQLIDLLRGGPRAAGDALAARTLDRLRMAPLPRRHGQHDGLHAVQFLLVDLHLRELVTGQARDHPEQGGQRPHAADLLELVEEILERELVLAKLALELLGLVLVDRLLGLLDERQDVAHAEDPLGHAVRVEAFEVAELLAGGGEQDRLAGDGLDRQRRAAAGVAVELGEDHAVELRDLGELLGDVDGVLAGHGVDDQQHVRGPDGLLDLGQLRHKNFVDVEAARGVDDQPVLAAAPG